MPETRCPVCNCHEGYEAPPELMLICGHCGALFNFTPFGPRLIDIDARKHFPECAHLGVDMWLHTEEDRSQEHFKSDTSTRFIRKYNF